MADISIRRGILTMARGELFANISRIPGQIALPGNGSGVVVPIPAGVDDGHLGDYSGRELKKYLDHGMAFSGIFRFSDSGRGLKLVGAVEMRPIDHPDMAQVSTINGIMAAAELLADYRDARTGAGVDLTLHDWQGVEREDKTTPDSLKLRLNVEEQRILLTTRDGRKVDLEMQDGDLRVMAYENEDGKEAPVVTVMPRDGDIRTDREDYDREARFEPDAPEM